MLSYQRCLKVLLLLAACLLIAGCSSSAKAPGSDTQLDVKVIEAGQGQVVDAHTATKLRLYAEYRKGKRLLDVGQIKEAATLLRAVFDEAARKGIALPPPEESKRPVPAPAPETVPMVPPESGTPSESVPSVETVLPPIEPEPEMDDDANLYGVHLPALDKPGVADKLISVDFNQVDIRIVLKTISEVTGVNFLVDDKITGTVTLISPTRVRLADVYRTLESILEVKGYAAIPSGNLVKIVSRSEAAKRNVLTRVGSDPATIPLNDMIVTQIMPLRYIDAAEANNLIAPLVAVGAHVAVHARTNAIMITDTSSNIHHIAKIIRQFDVPGPKDEISVITLKYASAGVLSDQLATIMEQTDTPANASGRRAQSDPANAALRILADARTNSLIVLADLSETEVIRGLVKRLDVERPLEASNIHVVYLRNATAEELVEPLSKAVATLSRGAPGAKTDTLEITADASTNALIITASPQDFKVIEDMIAKLDIVREQVLVEMRIVEATEDALMELGFDWATLDEAVANSVRGFGYTDFGVRVDAASGDLEGLAVGAFKKIGPDGTTQIGAIFNALESNSGVNILSTPHILTSNHQEATIVVGENIPYVTESRITESDPATPTAIKTFEYKDVGITLVITPHISQGELVRLEIETEFTKLIETAAGMAQGTPTTAKREAKTVISVLSGRTVVIGGLMRDDSSTIEKQIPLLGDIPLLGNLFKWKKETVQKTNLLLFITPHVLATPDEVVVAQGSQNTA